MSLPFSGIVGAYLTTVRTAAVTSKTNVLLNCDSATAEWKRIFVDVLLRLMPDINPDAAEEVADAQHLLFSHHSPACSATKYAQHANAKASEWTSKLRRA